MRFIKNSKEEKNNMFDKTIALMRKMGKKGQASAEVLTDKLIGVVVFVFIAAALVPIALTSFTNLSTSGIALASLFTTVLGIILAVAIFKGVLKGLRF